RLTSIANHDNQVTQINLSPAGFPYTGDGTIIAPGSQTSTFTIGSAGYLTTLANPATEATQLSYYGTGGLLKTLKDPKLQTYSFMYDNAGLGRLTRDDDPAGGFKMLSRTESSPLSWAVNLTTALSRAFTYQTTQQVSGDTVQTNTNPS